jgi:uncharacterized membrane protein YagU involved in acid resistance
MIAAMALGKEVMPRPGTWASYSMKIMAMAMMIHFALSIVYGLIGAWLAHRFDWLGALLIGAALGLAIYIVNFYMVAPVAFPWFEMARNWIGVFAHVTFGAILGLCYIGLRKPKAAAMH